MLAEPDRTQFDLNFSLLGIPVRVSPWFWLVSAMLGWDFLRAGIAFLLVWIIVVFVSILVHEMGHVLIGQLFGTRGHILLYSFGGLAIGSSNLANRWQRVAVYFAGPFAGFLLYGVVVACVLVSGGEMKDAFQARLGEDLRYPLLMVLCNALIRINLFWGLLNLAPIHPLDGGQISREVFDWVMPGGQGLRTAFGLSMVVAGLLAVNAFVVTTGGTFIPFLEDLGGFYMAIFFVLFAVSSYQMMEQVRVQQQRPFDEDDRLPWERDRDREPWRRDPDRWER